MFLHATGSFEPPRYPTVPIMVNERPDSAAAESFRRDLDSLNRKNPTPFADMPRYRLVEGWNRVKFWCGWDTSRYPDRIIKRQVGWLVHLRDKRDRPLYDKEGRPQLKQLPMNPEDWPSEFQKYSGPSSIKVPDVYFFMVGRMNYIVEEWISPELACKGWDENRYAVDVSSGEKLDVLGAPPVRGDYIPVLVIADEVTGGYETPSRWHFDIIEAAHKLREERGRAESRPGYEVSMESLRDAAAAYHEAAMKAVEKDEEEFAELAMEKYSRVAHRLNESYKPQVIVPSNYGEQLAPEVTNE